MSASGTSGSTGGFRVHRYVDKAGHECAYYDTALLFPTNALSLSAEPTGVAVLDMTRPGQPGADRDAPDAGDADPARVGEHQRRARAARGGDRQPGGVAGRSSTSTTSARTAASPSCMASAPGRHLRPRERLGARRQDLLPDVDRHGQHDRGRPDQPAGPPPLWQARTTRTACPSPTTATAATSPRATGSSSSTSPSPGPQAQPAGARDQPPDVVEHDDPADRHPGHDQGQAVPRRGRRVLAVTEAAASTAHGASVGAARIIDISDARKPFVVSNIRLQVHQPENREAIAGDPGAQSPAQGYAAHYCNVPQRARAGDLRLLDDPSRACASSTSATPRTRRRSPTTSRRRRRSRRPAGRSSTSGRTGRCRSRRSRPSAARSGTRTGRAASTR